jgi:serine/threonine protein kinase
MYELITGLPPYYNSDQFKMQKDIISKTLNIQSIPQDCLSLIQGLLEKDPNKRLGAKYGIAEIKSN